MPFEAQKDAEWGSFDRNGTKVVQLGDIIDGCNSKLKQSEKALKTVLDVLSRRWKALNKTFETIQNSQTEIWSVFEFNYKLFTKLVEIPWFWNCRSPVPRYDLMGNHELYNLHRDALEKWGLRCGAAGCSSKQFGWMLWSFLSCFWIGPKKCMILRCWAKRSWWLVESSWAMWETHEILRNCCEVPGRSYYSATWQLWLFVTRLPSVSLGCLFKIKDMQWKYVE